MNENVIPSLLKLSSYNCRFFDGQICDFTKLPRPFYIVSYINKGCATFSGSSGTAEIKAGDMLYIPYGETYKSYWYGCDEMNCTSIFFNFFPECDSLLMEKFNMQKYTCGIDEKKLIMSLSDCGGHCSFDTMYKFYKLLSLVFVQLEGNSHTDTAASIQNAVNYLDINYKENITIHELAQMCYLSDSRFCHLFTELMGVSPITYKNRITISNAAKELRLNPKKSVEDISSEYGFSSSTYFRRIVKKFTGKSPKQLRYYDII